MKTKATRKPFADPFDALSDAEFEREVLEALAHGTTKTSRRVPNELRGRHVPSRTSPGRRASVRKRRPEDDPQ